MNPLAPLSPPALGSAATPPPPGWSARLDLQFAQVAGRTRLTGNRHEGPLRLLKALPGRQPDAPLEAIILHPPGGLAGGDTLTVAIAVEPAARVLATTPGAQKWYRQVRAGQSAQALTRLQVGQRGWLEWLPQPAIVYDGADIRQQLDMSLAGDATLIGWEILVRGRSAMGERFARGRVEQRIRLTIDGAEAWSEQLAVAADDRWFDSPVGWRGCTVAATVWCALPAIGDDVVAGLLAAWRETLAGQALGGATRVMPGLLLARVLGHDSEAVLASCQALWRSARISLRGEVGDEPRIWCTGLKGIPRWI